jgi:excisionase family DNA binding protein
MTVDQAAEELNVSGNQIRAMLHNGELGGIQIGGRGIWRIGRVDLESYIGKRVQEYG